MQFFGLDRFYVYIRYGCNIKRSTQYLMVFGLSLTNKIKKKLRTRKQNSLVDFRFIIIQFWLQGEKNNKITEV